MRRVHHLLLAPRMGEQLGAPGGTVNDQKFIRLQSIGSGRKHERLFQGLPDVVGDFLGRVKNLGGVTPLKGFQELLWLQVVHNSIQFQLPLKVAQVLKNANSSGWKFHGALIWQGARIVFNPQRPDMSRTLRVETTRAPVLRLKFKSGHHQFHCRFDF